MATKLKWCAERLADGWWALLLIARLVWACRAPGLSVAIGFGLIAWTDQARDIVIASGLPSPGNSDNSIFIAVVFWAVFAWYWARTTLDYEFALPVLAAGSRQWRKGWIDFWAAQMPRIIGALGIFSVALAFWTAHNALVAVGDLNGAQRFRDIAENYALYSVIFYAAVALRRTAMRLLIQRTPLIPTPGLANLLAPGVAPIPRVIGLSNPLTLIFLIASLAASPLFYALVAMDPVGVSDRLHGAVPAVLFGLALTVPVTSALVILSMRLMFPFFGLSLIWLMVAPGWFGDIHDARTCRSLALSNDPAKRCAVQVERPTLKQAFLGWWRENAAADMTKPIAGPNVVTVPPMIVVATAGGASRAAFWTTQVLGEIAEREPRFADRLFMISGVSGGSLGATVFRSLVEVDRRSTADNRGAAFLKEAAKKGRDFVENDFLGPTLAAGLYVDLPSSSALPLLLPPRLRPDDRAAALEKAWEHAWATRVAQVARPFGWTSGFSAVFAGDRPWPVLALNGTSVEKGKRIITSNARFWSKAGDSHMNMSGGINRYDTLEITQSDIPISTAVTMSARFPVISPTGALRDDKGKVWTRITDGGLFENFGAFTADEVLRYLVSRVSEVQNGQYQTVPIAILISSDPSLDQLHLRQDGAQNVAVPDCARVKDHKRPPPREHPGNAWPECPVDAREDSRLLIDPVLALYDGRVARGEAAATALSDRIRDLRLVVRDRLIDPMKGKLELATVRARLGLDDHIDFFHFRQCRVDHVKGPTMSWHDSDAAWTVMRRMLGLAKDSQGVFEDPCGNQAEFFRLCVRLARLTGQSADDQAATDACATKWPKPTRWTCSVEHPEQPRPWCRVE